jgi:hypothetical protein
MGNISGSAALKLAESAAFSWYKANKKIVDAAIADPKNKNVKVNNTGTEDFVSPAVEKGVVDTWKAKAAFNGLERRGSMSSGESKIDLKLAVPGQAVKDKTNAAKFKADLAAKEAAEAELIAKLMAKKQARDKALKALEGAVLANWNKLPAKQQKAFVKDEWVAARVAEAAAKRNI